MRTTLGEHLVVGLFVAGTIAIVTGHLVSSGTYGHPVMDMPAGLAEPPHIALPRPDRVTIAYRTSNATRGGVRFGRPGEPGVFVSPTGYRRRHAIELEGLQPGTPYVYRVYVDDRPTGPRYRFVSPPASDQPVRIAVVGDTGSGSARAFRIVDRLRAEAPTLVLHTGDCAYPKGTSAEVHTRFVVPYAPLRSAVPLLTTLGNHDVRSKGGAPLLDAITLPRHHAGAADGENYYTWRHGPVQVVCINTETSLAPGTPQRTWLEDVLSHGNAPWTLVWGHRAIYEGSRSGGDEALQEHLVPLLEKHDVALYLSGHDHVYMRTKPMRGGVPVDGDAPTYVVSGGGGKSLYKILDVPHNALAKAVDHIVVMDIEVTSLRLRAVEADGKTFDTFTR